MKIAFLKKGLNLEFLAETRLVIERSRDASRLNSLKTKKAAHNERPFR